MGVGAALTRLMLFLLTMGYAAFSIGAMSWTIARLKHGRTDATTLLVATLVLLVSVRRIASLTEEFSGSSRRPHEARDASDVAGASGALG